MEHWINLVWPVDELQMNKIWNFHEIMGDTIVYHFHILGVDLTNAIIRGEVYDLNVSNRMATENGGALSSPEIVITDGPNGKFTATVDAGLTSTMQQYAQVEFAIWTDGTNSGPKYTIMQQPIRFSFERIVWSNESQYIVEGEEGTGEDPLF